MTFSPLSLTRLPVSEFEINLALSRPCPTAIRAPPIYPIREIRIPHLDMTRLFLSRVRSDPAPKRLSLRCPVLVSMKERLANQRCLSGTPSVQNGMCLNLLGPLVSDLVGF